MKTEEPSWQVGENVMEEFIAELSYKTMSLISNMWQNSVQSNISQGKQRNNLEVFMRPMAALEELQRFITQVNKSLSSLLNISRVEK